MQAFISASPLLLDHTSSCSSFTASTPNSTSVSVSIKRRVRSNVPRASANKDGNAGRAGDVNGEGDAIFSMDILPSFEALCWRAQQQLCEDAAAADGLGTFCEPPMVANPVPGWRERQQRREMHGGRAFSQATVDVVRSTLTANEINSHNYNNSSYLYNTSNHFIDSNNRRRNKTIRRNDNHNSRQSVGVTINLHPRSTTLPRLRAAVHYFEVGGLSWWFEGSVDLFISSASSSSSSSSFIAGYEFPLFFKTWQRVCDRHRASNTQREPTVAFLTSCLDTSANLTQDRDVSFRFASDFVDALLPTYLPLLAGRQHGLVRKKRVDFVEIGDVKLPATWAPYIDLVENHAERSEMFALSGGAICESIVFNSSQLSSWRFALSPSTLTAAGKAYSSLRDLAHTPFSPISNN